MVRMTGLEPAHLTASEPQSDVSASFTTSAYIAALRGTEPQNDIDQCC